LQSVVAVVATGAMVDANQQTHNAQKFMEQMAALAVVVAQDFRTH
jgi:hypothetical protein